MPPGRRLSQHPNERSRNDHRSYLPPPPKPPTSCRTHGGVSPSFLPQEIADAPIPGRSPPAAINGNDHGPQGNGNASNPGRFATLIANRRPEVTCRRAGSPTPGPPTARDSSHRRRWLHDDRRPTVTRHSTGIPKSELDTPPAAHKVQSGAYLIRPEQHGALLWLNRFDVDQA